MSLKVYGYKACSTCQKAFRFLEKKKIPFESHSIVDQPPSEAELKKMLGHLKASGETFKKLFNTSGQLYRELGIADQLKAGMDEKAAIALLAKNGKLIKRPFALSEKNGTVGFQEDLWTELFS